MPRKEENPGSDFSGFIARRSDGSVIFEKENYYSPKLRKIRATNWSEIDKKEIETLELVWRGKSIISLNRKDLGLNESNEWFFSQIGYKDIDKENITVVSRNIGYTDKSMIHVFSVEEKSGILRTSIRARP